MLIVKTPSCEVDLGEKEYREENAMHCEALREPKPQAQIYDCARPGKSGILTISPSCEVDLGVLTGGQVEF